MPRPAELHVPPAVPDASQTPAVLARLQVALHVLVASLLGFTLVRIALDLTGAERLWCSVVALVFAGTYVIGTVSERRGGLRGRRRPLWLLAVTVLWALLVVHVPAAAYLVFPLFFLAQAVLGARRGTPAVAALLAVAVVALGLHRGWSVAGVVGPAVGAVVALGIGLGVRALAQESRARQRALAELVATRDALAARERDMGRDAERARLAGEIHDTVAQGLGSIAMLLRAVERSDPEHPAIERIRLARSTAVDSLAETRQLVAALRPAVLEGTTLVGALERVAGTVRHAHPGVTVELTADETVDPAPAVASALVRITQEATTNAAVHGRPTVVGITLDGDGDRVRLTVRDDGRGFDTGAVPRRGAFGLEGMTRRAADLGGVLDVESAPGRGTRVVASLPLGSGEGR